VAEVSFSDLLGFAFLTIPLLGAYAMFALGITAIYRASRVLNLAHGAMATLPAYVFYTLVETAGMHSLVALPLAIISGALLGVGVELLFVRRLRPQGATAQTVGTVAVTGLLVALTAKMWGTSALRAPLVFPDGSAELAGIRVGYGSIGLLVVGMMTSAAMFAFFRYTSYGLAMRGAAQNRTAARLMGVDPDRAASVAWAIGGGLAGLAGILLSAVTALDPYSMSLQVLPAFVAALLGGLGSLLGAIGGAVVVAMIFGLVPALGQAPLIGGLMRSAGATQLVLTVLALVVMAVRGRRFAGSEESEAGFSGGSVFKRLDPGVFVNRAVVAFLVLAVVPWVVRDSVLGASLKAMEYSLIAISLVILIGWVGQISLAQATFVGLGAFVTGVVTRGFGIGFPLSAVFGAAAGMGAAVLLGSVALRVRGLYLAVATMIFAWMGQEWLFRASWLGVSGGSSGIPNQTIGTPGSIPSFDLTSRKVLYYVFLSIIIAVLVAAANLRDTRTGRAFFAVRGSEMAAASLGIAVTRTKLAAFAVSGLLAGLAGTLVMVEQRGVSPSQFFFTASLQFLAMAVVGGLTSLAGAVAAGVLFASLTEVFFRYAALSGWLEVVSAALLATVLLLYPGGLAAAPAGMARVAVRYRGTAAGKVIAWAVDALTAAGGLLLRGLQGMLAVVISVMPWSGQGRDREREREPVGKFDWMAIGDEPRLAVRAGPSEFDSRDDTVVLEPPLRAVGTGSVAQVDAPVRDDRPREERQSLIEAADITVRFGGLTAVSDASLAVYENEIVGLIGPNGAGKTTLFNAILGLNEPAAGAVYIHGQDVSGKEPHERARLGVARTFQVVQLFNELDVSDNLLVATHMHNDSGILSNIMADRRTIMAEAAARRRVDRIIELLRLEDVANAPVADLPFGLLRMVELGRALVTGAPLLMLDEAASGLNETETDRLVDVVRDVRDLGVSVLLIEHDIRMVTSVSDYIYVLDRGKMIATGTPDEVKRHPDVITAYLGAAADEDAVEVEADA
jgi:ABC-type branched-subunit amino acid transport system ATPase component/branched-subunit amino acid ABC-type transport system permease component